MKIFKLMNDKGTVFSFDLVSSINLNDKTYLLLSPAIEEEHQLDEEIENDKKLVIMKVKEIKEKDYIFPIEDKEEITQVFNVFKDTCVFYQKESVKKYEHIYK